MALILCLGGAGTGKSHAVYEHIIEESLKAPDRRFLVLVPEQATMETQRSIVKLHPRHGIMNIEVLSITRLSYRVFDEMGYRKEEMLEEIGKTFLLEKIALEEKKNLSYYGDLIGRPEFLAEMKALISECLLYGVGPEQLKGILGDSGGEGQKGGAGSPFEAKISDISRILEAFRSRLEGTYLTKEELPARLAGLVGESRFIRGAVVVLDGFTGFTPLQLLLIKKLMTVVRDMIVTVTADARELSGEGEPGREFFALSREMTADLIGIAEETGTPAHGRICVPSGVGRHALCPALGAIERNLFRPGNIPDGGDEGAGRIRAGDAVRLFEAVSGRDEIRYAAREICRLVREEGYRYRDFAVVTGNLSAYGNYVREIFIRYGIPFFVDEKRALKKNPFMEFLRAALEAVTENYSYSSMFRMLRSGMTDFDPAAIDHLENYAAACGIRGRKMWREPFIRHYRGEDKGELLALNALRKEIMDLLDPLTEALARRGGTVREKTAALCDFCFRVRAEEKLREKERHFADEGRRDLAREYAQVWPYIVSFLDKLVAVLGKESISMRDYRELLEAGFAESRVAIIPPGNDQVVIGDVERSRLQDVRVLFFVGVNEGVVPKAPSAGGVLTEADRQRLFEKELKLKPVKRQQLEIDRFYLYLTLTKPSDRLILSWTMSNAAGEVMRPSFLISSLMQLFPDLVKERDEEDLLMLVEREDAGISLIAPPLASLDKGELSPAYLELFSYYLHHGKYSERVGRLLHAAGIKSREDRISRASAKALYGEVLKNSASRLEKFFECRYAHFLSYGLKLKERPEYAFTGLDMGSVIHRALEIFAKRCAHEGHSWAELSGNRELRDELAASSVRTAATEYGSGVLAESARDRYKIERMTRLMEETVWAQSVQLAAGDFVPAELEAAFLERGDASLMELPLSGGAKMYLTGRIDRADVARESNVKYIKVIDYKTGSARFDLLKVYYGLQMQLPVYANAAMNLMREENAQNVLAGMFYAEIRDPVVDAREGESEEETRARVLKELRMSGVAAADKDAVRHMDRNLTDGSESDVIPVGLKKDGGFTARSSVLSPGDLQTVCRYVKRLAGYAAEEMMSGSVSVDPYELRGDTACTFCPYGGVCGFDIRIPGCTYRGVRVMDEDQILMNMDDGSEDA